MINSNETVIDKIVVDLYNRKVIVKSNNNTTVILKCSSITELTNLVRKCREMLKVNNVVVR